MQPGAQAPGSTRQRAKPQRGERTARIRTLWCFDTDRVSARSFGMYTATFLSLLRSSAGFRLPPRANALGCILTPLRGWLNAPFRSSLSRRFRLRHGLWSSWRTGGDARRSIDSRWGYELNPAPPKLIAASSPRGSDGHPGSCTWDQRRTRSGKTGPWSRRRNAAH